MGLKKKDIIKNCPTFDFYEILKIYLIPYETCPTNHPFLVTSIKMLYIHSTVS